MGIASLVMGIIALIFGFILGWIPLISFAFPVIAVVGLIFGIVDTVKKSKTNESKGISIAGIIVSAFAVMTSVSMLLISNTL